MRSLQIDAFPDGEAGKEREENVQDSGWFEVKKKHRSSAKSAVSRSGTAEKNPVESLGKYKQNEVGHVRPAMPTSIVCEFKEPNGLHAEKALKAPKIRWGDLEDEDISENFSLKDNLAKQAESSFLNEDSTMILQGGKQSSTKELNGIKRQLQEISSGHGQITEMECTSSVVQDSSTVQKLVEAVGQINEEHELLAEDIKVSVEDSAEFVVHVSPEKEEDFHLGCDGTQEAIYTTANIVEEDPIHLPLVADLHSDNDQVPEIALDMKIQGECQKETNASAEMQSQNGSISNHNADRDNECSSSFERSASVLMDKLEETESAESKERFRQRLWCYLFENLNRAIDELYFLCELECDQQQIQEALLVLKEAGLDFSELKSRVQGFEKVKKQHQPKHQVLLSGNLTGVFSGKVEHRRPHAIAWEVRRMACSPHRAEILSSSLETFKKVQQIAASGQPKRRDAAKLLELGQNSKDLPTKVPSSANVNMKAKDASFKVEDKFRMRANASRNLWQTAQVFEKMAEKVGNNVLGDVLETGCPKVHQSARVATTNEITGSVSTTEGKVVEPTSRELAFVTSKYERNQTCAGSVERMNKSSDKRVSIVDNESENRVPKTRNSLDAWKVKRNWSDVLSSPLKSSNRASRSPCPGWKSTERVKVLHDKLMSPERKRKSPLEMKKEVDEKQVRATRIRRELESERVQRLQRTTEKLNRVTEWQAVRSNKLREGMHARHQRGESRHEAHLAEIARRASDESIKVSEVRFITSLNEENKKLSLRQKLQDSELRRAERLQIIKIKQKEDIAREEAVLERRRLLEAERLQRIAETQRKKEEAKARRDEERKAASAAREARAVEQVRKKEVRAKAQQEEAELQAQKLIEKLKESELRRKVYLEQIRERAAMESREQASPSTRRPSSRDGHVRNGNVGSFENDSNAERESTASRQASGSKGATCLQHHQAFKRRVKKIRQRLMTKKYDFVEPPLGTEASGLGSNSVAAAAKSKIGRWLQELHRLQQARKAGSLGVALIIGEMIKYLDGKEAELHAARQAGLVDFVATALPASYTFKPEASQTTISLVRTLKVLLSLPANRSYFIAKNLLPPLIPMLSIALANFSSLDSAGVVSMMPPNGGTDKMLWDEKLDAIGEVLNGLLECVILIVGHNCVDDRQVSMKEDLLELIVACEAIHHLRDLFSLFDRPQIEGAPFPTPVLFGLNLLQSLTGSRTGSDGLSYDTQLNTVIENHESGNASCLVKDKNVDLSICSTLTGSTQSSLTSNEGVNSEEPPHACEENALGVSLEVVNVTDSAEKDASTFSPVEFPRGEELLEATKMEVPISKAYYAVDSVTPVTLQDGKLVEIKREKKLLQQGASLYECRSIAFLVSVIAETGLVGLPSLLTAVLLQANPRSTPDQASAALPSNFEEAATGVLKVLNNLARLDLALVQSLLARPDLQMEFFHLVSFLLTHCTIKWSISTDQVASLLLETLLLLGYFSLLHPGNQAVLRWGKSPTILHKICDLPFAFFSDPEMMPILVGTLLAVCYGSEQNRDVVCEELSMDMLLSLLTSSRNETLSSKEKTAEDLSMLAEPMQTANQNSQMGAKVEELEEETQLAQDGDASIMKDDLKRRDSTGSDTEMRQPIALRSTSSKSPNNKKSMRVNSRNATMEGDVGKGKGRGPAGKSGSSSNTVVPLSVSKRPPVPLMGSTRVGNAEHIFTADEESDNKIGSRYFLLQNRFPTRLLDAAQQFFSVGI